MNRYSKTASPSSQVFANVLLIKGSHMAKTMWERIQKNIEDTKRKILRRMVYCKATKVIAYYCYVPLQSTARSLSGGHFEALTFIAFGAVISPLGVCPVEST